MLQGIKPTKEESTRRVYLSRTKELTRRCRKELNTPDHEILDLRQFVGWLIENKPIWARTTWRQYKASVVYFLETLIQEENDPIAQECYDMLIDVGVEGCVKKTKKTSGKKLKKFPIEDFNTIIYYLMNHVGDSKWYEALRRWLISGLLTGLRPVEWATAQISNISGETCLIVKNAKHTNGRAHGEYRTIILNDLTNDEIDIIKKHVEYCNEWNNADQFPSLYASCGRTLSKVCKLLWKKRSQYPCLYSARHQFSADAKASGLSREEIAALMGHAVDDTATKHYGKKTAGSSYTRVKPTIEDVLKVRQVYEQKYFGINEPKPSLDKTIKNNITPSKNK